jgi:hypothetical protein
MEANGHEPGHTEVVRGAKIEQRACDIVDRHCHFQRRASQFEFQYEENILIVRGSVPTFYLKQLLQSALRDLDGVLAIDNQVQVVSSQGLSSSSLEE